MESDRSARAPTWVFLDGRWTQTYGVDGGHMVFVGSLFPQIIMSDSARFCITNSCTLMFGITLTCLRRTRRGRTEVLHEKAACSVIRRDTPSYPTAPFVS